MCRTLKGLFVERVVGLPTLALSRMHQSTLALTFSWVSYERAFSFNYESLKSALHATAIDIKN
jgi:hypothetical protein